ncbi:serine O-acetyltransferase [Azonexus sp. IMCC34842]|uniref:serine O-acetyltransferase n=1 Tax=Azonexus sp. IMCC34842 TaxID=3420950 RepID=UPI003D0CDCA8
MMQTIWRLSNHLHRWRVPVLPKLCYAFNRIVFSSVVPPGVQMGKGVLLGYKGLGIIIHRRAVIGNNVLVGAHVTIGGRGEFHDVPVIEDDVMIGTGAKILGPVRIGRGARIGANAVVVKDVPPGATATGIPARVLGEAN